LKGVNMAERGMNILEYCERERARAKGERNFGQPEEVRLAEIAVIEAAYRKAMAMLADSGYGDELTEALAALERGDRKMNAAEIIALLHPYDLSPAACAAVEQVCRENEELRAQLNAAQIELDQHRKGGTFTSHDVNRLRAENRKISDKFAAAEAHVKRLRHALETLTREARCFLVMSRVTPPSNEAIFQEFIDQAQQAIDAALAESGKPTPRPAIDGRGESKSQS
jgi:chromosome segregation ATPase